MPNRKAQTYRIDLAEIILAKQTSENTGTRRFQRDFAGRILIIVPQAAPKLDDRGNRLPLPALLFNSVSKPGAWNRNNQREDHQ